MEQLKHLLNQASTEEITALATILSASRNINGIVEQLSWNSQDLLKSLYCFAFNHQSSYKEIVQQVAGKLKVQYRNYESTEEIEIKIAQKVMETVWEQMTPVQRQEMEAQLRATAAQFNKGGELLSSVSVFGSLMAARLSGFGIYLLASTTLGAVTGVLGLTLPFVVYTTMSSAIAVVIGPVGWIGAGLFAIRQVTGPNYQKLIPAVLYICALRARLNGGFA